MPHHILGDRRLGDHYAQFEQLAVNARSTPDRIVPAHRANQIANLPRHTGPTRFVATALQCRADHPERPIVPIQERRSRRPPASAIESGRLPDLSSQTPPYRPVLLIVASHTPGKPT